MAVEIVPETVSVATFYWVVGGMGTAFSAAIGYVLKQINGLAAHTDARDQATAAALLVRDKEASQFREKMLENTPTKADLEKVENRLVAEFRRIRP